MDIEELNLDGEELEIIDKPFPGNRYGFPAVTFTESVAYFNKASKEIVPEFVEWAVTPDYVIGLKAKEGNRNAYKVRFVPERNYEIAVFPTGLKREKKLKPGTYKLYKCKGGFAFKRYEPIGG